MASVALSGPSVLAHDNLLQCYSSEETAKAIQEYWDDFQLFADGFLPVLPTVVENGGTKLVLLRCPIDLPHLRQPGEETPPGVAPVCLGILFTPHFPKRAPVCAIILDASCRVQIPMQEHSDWLAPNLTVRVAALPDIPDPAKPPLFALLLGVTAKLAHCPVAVTAAASPSPSSASSPSQQLGGSSTTTTAVTGGGGSFASAAPSSSLAPTLPPPPLPPVSPAAPSGNDAVEAAAAAMVCDYVLLKEQCVRRLSELHESRVTLERLQTSLRDKEATLLAAIPVLAEREAEASALVAASSNVEPLTMFNAPDELRTQAVELLSEIMALEDLLDLYERRLRKGTIQSAAYLRFVGDAARRQFLAKYKLKKLHGFVTAKHSLAALMARYPQLDRELIMQVLDENNYSFTESAGHLSEMVRGSTTS